MSVIFSSHKNCYCAFCKSPRRVYLKRSINLLDVFGALLGAMIAMYLLFQTLDPRGLIVWVAFLAVAETFVKLRWRMTIACRRCGFDPVLYMKDTQLAVEKVKTHIEKRKLDPASWLAAPLALPKIPRERADLIRKAEEGVKGSLLTRQI